jgi:hypothetical protein
MFVPSRAASAAIVSTLLLLSGHDVRAERKPVSAVVRLIYLVPSDRRVEREYVKRLEAAAEHVQIWMSDQLGGTTFSLPKKVVEVVKLPQPAEYYSTNPNGDYGLWFWNNVLRDAFAATGGTFFDPNNVWAFYIDSDPACGQAIGATSGVALLGANDLRGLADEPTTLPCGGPPPDYDANVCRWVGGLGHELGHAFGLPHPPTCDDDDVSTACPADTLMFVGYITYPQTYLLDENKAALAQTPFFSPVDLKHPLGACAEKH